MAVSFREGVTFTSAPSDPQALNPGTDPASDAILIIAAAQSNTSGAPTAATLASDSFGGTWAVEHNDDWGSRRRLQIWVNDDLTTPSGSVSVDFNSNQDRATGLLIVEGADTYTEDAVQEDGSGPDWSPTFSAGHDGHAAVIQMEDTADISTPAGWTKIRQVTDADGMRSLAVFVIVGQPPDFTPQFGFGSTNGFSAWSAYFTASSAPAPQPPFWGIRMR